MFINPKTKIYTARGNKNISVLRRGENIFNADGKHSKIEEVLKEAVPEDQRSQNVKQLYESKEWTYEQLGEEFGLSAASICHIINNRVGFETEVITIGYSPYNKDCIQVTPNHRLLDISGIDGSLKSILVSNLTKKDHLVIFERDKNTGEIQFVRRPIVVLERKMVKAKTFFDLSLEGEGDKHSTYIAKGVVCVVGGS
jgi:hypothetical protein